VHFLRYIGNAQGGLESNTGAYSSSQWQITALL